MRCTMEKIGNLLKEKRLEKGFTVEEISAKTRLTIKYIHAIEEGDISYFKDDLSYLRYFLRSYCDVLGIDFDEIKPMLQESINDYTATFTMQVAKDHEQIEANVAKNAKSISKPMQTASIKGVKKHHKPDLSLITLIGILAVIAVCLVLAVIYIFPQLGKSDAPKDNSAPVVEKPKPEEKDKEDKPDDAKPKADAVTIKQTTDGYHFEVSGLKDGDELTMELTFQSDVWFALSLDNVQQGEPASKIYKSGETATYKTAFKAGSQIMLRYGNMTAHEIKINGTAVKLDSTVTGNPSPANLYFDEKGQ